MSPLIFAALLFIPLVFSQTVPQYPAFQWIKEVDASGNDTSAGLGVDAQGNIYLAGSTLQGSATTHDVYVFKLASSGDIIYSQHLGGSGDDLAVAMAVDASGDVYVTGTTTSTDFPVTSGAFSSTPPAGTAISSFVFKLNPDGSTAYSTYFSPAANPVGIAADGSGSVYLAGTGSPGVPTTQGAYQTQCDCGPVSNGFFTPVYSSGFVTKFNSSGTALVYSTYIERGQLGPVLSAMALAPDGSVYIGGPYGLDHLDATGSTLLTHTLSKANPEAMDVATDGSLYVAGAWNTPLQGNTQSFQTTPGAFESAPQPFVTGQTDTLIVKMDSQLSGIEASTFFGGPLLSVTSMAFDQGGNVFIGGFTGPQGLPTRMPLQGGFDEATGFVSELSGDLTTLEFSSYFGDLEMFGVRGIGIGPQGSLLLGGVTGRQQAAGGGPANLWANSLALPASPPFEINAVLNAASMTDGPLSPGETILIQGPGLFTLPGGQFSIGGVAVQPLTLSLNYVTLVVPQNVPAVAAEVVAMDGQLPQGPGSTSNQVLMPVAAVSPGIFSQNGTGIGQGLIKNQDGTQNSPSNPAKPGQQITLLATGVGPVTMNGGFAVSQYPVAVFIDGFYCDGVSAALVNNQTPTLGTAYQITVIVPDLASLGLTGVTLPAQSSLTMQVNGVSSQRGLTISIAQ